MLGCVKMSILVLKCSTMPKKTFSKQYICMWFMFGPTVHLGSEQERINYLFLVCRIVFDSPYNRLKRDRIDE
jgi:hypothetical protein